jgi:hypothetical protein
VEIKQVNKDIFDEAWKLFRLYKDKSLSFTDCTTIALARNMGIIRVFAFDDDFKWVGLETVP